ETPVLLADAPAGALVLLQRGQALSLRLLGDVHPQLDQDDPLVVQHPLELHDAVQRLVELALAALAERALDDGPGVPGAEEDRGARGGRQPAPEAPPFGARELVV